MILSNIERLRLMSELKRVESHKLEMQMRVAERQEDILRLETQIQIQDAKILELSEKLKEG